jgi:acylphosphatase
MVNFKSGKNKFMVQYEIKITGRVQGVWFRAYAQERAKEIGIKGWVKNNSDGNVLVMAQGEKQDIATFIDYLRTGSPLSRVENIFTSEINGLSDFDNFTIKY